MTIWYDVHGAGEPVLLLHSAATDSEMWDPQVEALSDRFQVIRADYRGYGRSALEPGIRYSDVEDVEEVLAALGVTRTAVVASSYSCSIALQLAAGTAVEVSRMLLFNPATGPEVTPDVKSYWLEEEELVAAGDIEGAAELTARLLLGPHADAPTRRHVTDMQRHAYEVQVAALPEPVQVDRDVRPADLDVPALVVCGAHELEFFRASARNLAADLPRGELVELDWAGHLPSLERPKEITRLIGDYL
ncbi:MAG: alpha/beta hydrolase [Nonomuraea sp.]|nr:alpha/beta hydrolase [Nonomuraea sp.]